MKPHRIRYRARARMRTAACVVAFATLTLSSVSVAQEPETQVIDRDWPKELSTTDGGTLVVYQPQVETWTDFTTLEG